MDEKASLIYKLVVDANKQMFKLWKTEMIFTWRWWLLLALTIIPWILWIKFKRTESASRIMLAGLTVILITSYLDLVGIVFGAWHYSWKVLPIIPGFIPYDFSLFPVSIMFFIQCKPKVSPFIKAFIFSLTAAFIFESIFKLLGLYTEDNWSSSYSFFIYILIYLIAHFISKRTYFNTL